MADTVMLDALVVARYRAAQALRAAAAQGDAPAPLPPDPAVAAQAAAVPRRWATQHAAAALRLDAGSLIPRDL